MTTDNSLSTSTIEISPERRERIINRILEILAHGNNVQIKRRSNGVIAVMEIKAQSYNI